MLTLTVVAVQAANSTQCRSSISCFSPGACPAGQRCRSAHTSYRQDCGLGCGYCECRVPGPAPVAPPVAVTIHAAQAAHRTAPSFLGVNLDSSRIGTLDFGDPVLLKLASRFGGSIFRVGGTDADLLFWNTTRSSSVPPWAADHIVNRNVTLDIAVWDRLYNFSRSAGLHLLYDLNAMGSRTRHGVWDPTNAAQLLAHIVSHGLEQQGTLLGFQFGNEPFLDGYKKTTPAVSGMQLARDLRTLHGLIAAANLSSAVPMLQGPDEACVGSVDYWKNKVACVPDQAHFAEFVPGAASVASSFSFHFYRFSGSGGCTLHPTDLIDATKLGEYAAISDYMNVARDLGAGHVPMILSETSAVSCGGCKGVSDTFVHSLWFIDLLGRASGHLQLHQLYRQALFGPDAYALVQTAGGRFARVTPDYFTAMLWTRVVGPTILSVAGGSDTLRLYAACSRGAHAGAPTLVFANWAPTPVNISLAADGTAGAAGIADVAAGVAAGIAAGGYGGWRAEYHLTPSSGSLTSRTVSLNGGAPLGVDSELPPRIVTAAGSDGVVALAGYSLGFIVLLNATAPACSS